jgi:hypothetical protein
MRTTSDSITISPSAADFNFTLQFNLPATDLLWVVADDSNTDGDVLNNDWFNYGLTSGVDGVEDFFTMATLKINNLNREEARGKLPFFYAIVFNNKNTLLTNTRPNYQIRSIIFSKLPKSKDAYGFAKQLHVRVPIFCKYCFLLQGFFFISFFSFSPFQITKPFFFLFYLRSSIQLNSYIQKRFNLQVSYNLLYN